MSRKTRRNATKNAAKRARAVARQPDYTTRGISGIALGAMALSGPLYAADEGPATPASDKSNDTLQEVVVTGIRASLQKSLDIKQQSVGVVDAISAEDIGQFPDSNLAAAIQRVPGVSISRATTAMGGVPTSTGDATSITVRGFGPTFNETLIDGRQIATGLGNRGFDFSAVGADFVGEVDILKTPDSSLSSGAIGATINIKYPKPLDSPGLKLAASGSGTFSPKDGRVAPNGGLLFSDTFADDTFGVLADISYAKHDVRTNHVNIQGWEGVSTGADTDPNTMHVGQYAGTPPAIGSPNWFIQDYGVYREENEDKRIDGRLVFQWRPMDSLLVTLNDDYSEDKKTQLQYGYSVWFNAGSLTDVVRNSDGTLTSFTQPNTPTDFQGQINGQVLRNNEVGFNVAWDVTDHFKTEFDAAQSTSKLNPGGELSSIDVDVGYGPSSTGGINGANVGIAGVGTGSLPYPTSIGPNGNAAAFINNGLIGSHVLVMQSPRNDDTIDQLKLMGTWADEGTRVRFGMSFIKDTRNLSTLDTFTNNDWQAYAGYGPASNNTGGVALPQSFFNGSFGTANFITGFSNNGNLPANVLAFNPLQVLGYLQGLNGVGASPGCCNPPFTGTYQLALSPGSVQTIEEKTYAPFINVTQDAKIASMPLKINLGARFEETYLTSAGLGQTPVALTVQPNDHTAFLVDYTPTQPVVNKSHYKYLLPSLDLNLSITDELKARFDASRTLTRPPLNDITPVLNVPQGPRVGALTATGGNPGLLPFLSDNLDLGMEWYYAPNSYISVDGFLKEVTNFIVGGTVTQTINGVIDPTTGKLAEFSVTSQVNGPSAEVRGVEIGVQHMLWDTGFGVQGERDVCQQRQAV